MAITDLNLFHSGGMVGGKVGGMGGRDEGREGEREGGREGWKAEGGREVGREGWRLGREGRTITLDIFGITNDTF